MNQKKCDIGLIGPAVMRQNLVLNMSGHGDTGQTSTVLLPRSMDSSPMRPRVPVVGTHSIKELCS